MQIGTVTMYSSTQKLNTVVALFKSHTQAEQAVKELQKAVA